MAPRPKENLLRKIDGTGAVAGKPQAPGDYASLEAAVKFREKVVLLPTGFGRAIRGAEQKHEFVVGDAFRRDSGKLPKFRGYLSLHLSRWYGFGIPEVVGEL